MEQMRKFAIFLVIFYCLLQAGSAIKVADLVVTPTDNVQVGDSVTAHGTVNLGSNSWDESNYLELYTELDRPTVKWEYAIGINEKYPPVTTSGGQYLRIDGWLLSYPEDMYVSVMFTVDGVVPDKSGQLTIVRVREIDEDNDVVGTEVIKQLPIQNGGEITPTQTTSPPVTTTVIPTTTPTVTPTTPRPTASPSPTLTGTIPVTQTPTSDQSELIEQLKRQNQLLEEQNKRLAEQSGLLAQIINLFKRFFGL